MSAAMIEARSAAGVPPGVELAAVARAEAGVDSDEVGVAEASEPTKCVVSHAALAISEAARRRGRGFIWKKERGPEAGGAEGRKAGGSESQKAGGAVLGVREAGGAEEGADFGEDGAAPHEPGVRMRDGEVRGFAGDVGAGDRDFAVVGAGDVGREKRVKRNVARDDADFDIGGKRPECVGD